MDNIVLTQNPYTEAVVQFTIYQTIICDMLYSKESETLSAELLGI